MITYAGTLRDGYDEDTCRALVSSTIKAYRPKDKSLKSRIYNQVETSFSKVYFRRVFLRGSDKAKAAMMGVEPTLLDTALASAASAYIMPQIMAHLGALKVPVVDDVADKWLIRRLKRLLDEYGHPEYITDVSQYADGTATRPVFSRGQQRRQPAPA